MISLVDLGVVRDVAVEGEHVRVEFTPTFLGCPALEVDARADGRRGPRARRRARGRRRRSTTRWSTDRITPEGREKLREAGFAPPAPRAAGAAGARAARSEAPSAARTAARPRRAWRTSSARPRAARSATARAAASRSSSSRRSSASARQPVRRRAVLLPPVRERRCVEDEPAPDGAMNASANGPRTA